MAAFTGFFARKRRTQMSVIPSRSSTPEILMRSPLAEIARRVPLSTASSERVAIQSAPLPRLAPLSSGCSLC